MAAEVHPGRGRGFSVGYVIVLLGAALFVTSCFLPYYRFPAYGGTISLYQQTQGPFGDSANLGALLYLVGGVAPVVAVAVVVLVRGERGPVLPAVLTGAVIAWSLTWIGILLLWGSFLPASLEIGLEIGFWLQAVSIGVAVIGTILVWFGKRREVKDSHDRYANEDGVNADA